MKLGRSAARWVGPGIVTLVSGLLASCAAVGPDYHRPAVETPAAFKEAQGWKMAEPRDLESRGEWWRAYNDPELTRLVEQIRISNQNVLAAEAQYRQAAALIEGARASGLPTVTASASSSRGRNAAANSGSASVSGTSLAQTDTTDRVSISVGWELDLWGRIRRTVEASQRAAQASAADAAAALLSAQATLAQTYLQLKVVDLDLGLLERSMAGYQRALEVTQNRYQAGVAQRSDVTQARTQLESARGEWLDLGLTRAMLEHTIAVLIGQPPAGFSIPRGDQVPLVPDTPLTLPSGLLERRPDVAAAERRMAAANAQIGIAKAAYFPTLDLTGTGGYQSDSFSRLLELPNRFWSLGASLVDTLFDAGARESQMAQSVAAYDQTVAVYRQTVLTAFQEVEDNLASLNILNKEADAERAAADAAEETLRISENQYEAGTVDYLNVVSAQNTSLSAERSYYDITSRNLVASVGLIKALGGGWSVDEITP